MKSLTTNRREANVWEGAAVTLITRIKSGAARDAAGWQHDM